MQPRNIQDDTLRVVCSLHGFSSHNIQAGWQVTTRYESQITYHRTTRSRERTINLRTREPYMPKRLSLRAPPSGFG